VSLRISKDLTLPDESVTETFGILAVRGAGKSNTAAVMAEEMFKRKLPFVVIDPDGSWFGVRSSRDGKGPGLSIPIFGGKHGDVPLERSGGSLVADLVAEHRLSCVLDLDSFESEGAKKNFLLDFARRLYAKNQDPLHLFLEEADDYIPQRPMRDEAQLLRAWENIVRRGRKRGIGITLITQRSAVVNKNVLTQVQTLIAMRTTGPQDVDAIEHWVRYHQQSREIIESLAGLEDGEAWVWSPRFLRKTVRVQFRLRETFDSASTPKVSGARKAPSTLADVDIGTIQQRMTATIERAKAEDPRELRRRITDLERELASKQAIKKEILQPKEKRVEIPVLKDAQVKRIEMALSRAEKFRDPLNNYLQKIDFVKAALSQATSEIMRAVNAVKDSQAPPEVIHLPVRATITAHRRSIPLSKQASPPPSGEVSDLKGPEQRILDAIGWLESLGIDAPEQTAVAFLARYKFGGGAFNNPRGRLRSMSLVEYLGSNQIRLTDVGRSLAKIPEAALTTQELHARVMARLKGPEQRILQPLLDVYPKGYTNEELSNLAGYSDGGGAYNNPRGRLRSMGLIEYRAGGKVFARDILFLERSP